MRINLWNLLRNLHSYFSIPWLCAGDFNELTKTNEKLGGRLRPYGQMKIFQEALDECGLRDLGFVGSKFTWFKNYPNGGIVWERLDRAVATNEWVDLFPATKVHTLEVGSSNRKPILILPRGFVVKQNRPWRFEQMWLEDDGCHDIVAATWSINPEGSPMFKVVEKINTCQKKFRGWSKTNFYNVCRILSEKKKSMKAVEELAVQGGGVDFFLQLMEEV